MSVLADSSAHSSSSARRRSAIWRAADSASVPSSSSAGGSAAVTAVMIAWAGIERLRAGLSDPLDHAPRPRWPLAELSA